MKVNFGSMVIQQEVYRDYNAHTWKMTFATLASVPTFENQWFEHSQGMFGSTSIKKE